MTRVIGWFVRTPVAANLLMTIFIVGGLVAVFQVRQEELPSIESNVVLVSVPYPGAAPEEVENGVLLRIEEAVAGIEGIRQMTSIANEGYGIALLSLETGANRNQTTDEVKTRIDAISTFPRETERPVVSLMPSIETGLEIVVSGEADERTLKQLAIGLRDDITALEGVSSVEVAFVRADEISIDVSERTLRRMGLTFDQVAHAVRRTSLDLPGGSIKSGTGEILVRTQGQAYRGEDFGAIVVVSREDGTRIRLDEIATIVDGFREGESEARFDGKPAAVVRVNRVGNEDVLEIGERVRRYVDTARLRMPEGVELTISRDQSESLRARIDILLGAGAGGLALVLLFLTVPLRFRLALWVAAGVPVAMLGTIGVLGAAGVTISTVSVVGFILVLGIVVDDAIVVGERVHAHEQEGKDRFAAAVDGTAEVGVPVIFGALTTIAAFTPLIFAPGILGQLVSVIGYVVAACLIFSIVESQLILPAHLAHRKASSPTASTVEANALHSAWRRLQQRVAAGIERLARDIYGPALDRVVDSRYAALAIGVGVLVVTLGLLLGGRVETQFAPQIESDQIVARLEMPAGVDVAQTARAARQIEQAALQLKGELDAAYPERPSLIEHIFTAVGQSSSTRSVVSQSHRAELVLSIPPVDERGNVSVGELSDRWRELTGPVYDSVSLTFDTMGLAVGDAIAIRLQGRDVDDLANAAAQLRMELARFEGVRDISDSFRSGKQEAKLSLLPLGRQLGLTLSDLARQARQAFYGEEVQRVHRGTEDVRVMVRYPEAERRSLGDLEDMRIRAADGTQIPFAAVAEIELGRSHSSITRFDRERVVVVRADVDRDTVSPEAVLQALMADALPRILSGYRGIRYSLGGEREQRTESTAGLFGLIPMALLMIFALLAIPLRSYLQPLVIMSIIPFGVVGAIAGHVIMGRPVTITSLFGLIALAGVVVNTSLVLVDYVNRQRRTGVDAGVAVRRAGIVRFRPILITSTTTFAGLTPLMLNDNPATAFFVPMAISLAWGLLFATVITLFLVPCIYLIAEDLFPTDPADGRS